MIKATEDKFFKDKVAEALKVTDQINSKLYTISEIHKPGTPRRPVVSSKKHIISKMLEFVKYVVYSQ